MLRSKATLGLEDLIDPVGGRQINVESASNSYWIDHRGSIVVTNTDHDPTSTFEISCVYHRVPADRSRS